METDCTLAENNSSNLIISVRDNTTKHTEYSAPHRLEDIRCRVKDYVHPLLLTDFSAASTQDQYLAHEY